MSRVPPSLTQFDYKTYMLVSSWTEINIGLICACVPSVNMLINIIRGKAQSSMRTNRLAINTFKRRAKADTKQISTGMVPTFDTELAMLSGDIATGTESTQSCRVGVDGRCKRIDSSDGRREGWLKVEGT